jgi:CheY-like chemotaxis protein/HPt (histidine-containing phosphotransfer) domain-containing protein
MRPEVQEKIFEAFEQVDGSASRRYGGTGLGLAISQELVRRMGGRIWVDSEMHKGTHFHFTVHLRVQPEPKPLFRDASGLTGLPVLVIDPDPVSGEATQGLLSSWRLVPTLVVNAYDALSAIENANDQVCPYALLMTESVLPEMDGFALVERLKGLSQPVPPVVVMLGSAQTKEDRTRYTDLGVAAVLTKPLNLTELMYTLVKALDGHGPCDTSASFIPDQSIWEASTKLRILLAEDNPINQRVATRLLEKMGHEVVIAGDGKEVIRNWEKEPFDLILMDVQMPEMDGYEATTKIRALPGENSKTPIVAMTAHAMASDRDKCLAVGMNDYLSKPLNVEEVLKVVHKYVSGQQNEKENSAPAAPETDKSEPQLYDLKAALPRFGDSVATFYEFMGAFITHLRKSILDLENAISIQDSQKVMFFSHSIKGAAANFEINSIRLAAQEIENDSKNGNLENAPALLDKIKSVIPLLEKDYQKNLHR